MESIRDKRRGWHLSPAVGLVLALAACAGPTGSGSLGLSPAAPSGALGGAPAVAPAGADGPRGIQGRPSAIPEFAFEQSARGRSEIACRLAPDQVIVILVEDGGGWREALHLCLDAGGRPVLGPRARE